MIEVQSGGLAIKYIHIKLQISEKKEEKKELIQILPSEEHNLTK